MTASFFDLFTLCLAWSGMLFWTFEKVFMITTWHNNRDKGLAFLIIIFALITKVAALMSAWMCSHTFFQTFILHMASRILISSYIIMALQFAYMSTWHLSSTFHLATSRANLAKIFRISYFSFKFVIFAA